MIDKRAVRTSNGARAIIEYNIRKLYFLPTKYHYLNLVLKDTKKELLKILHFIKDIEPIIWHNRYVWYLDNRRLTERVRRTTTYSVSNRRFNYLCCVGALRKQKQTDNDCIGINAEFKLETGRDRYINVFTVYRYTEKQLELMENRAKQLFDRNITASNISKDKLVAMGLKRLANEVYYANLDNSYTKKEKQLEDLLSVLEKHIRSKGYSTISEISTELQLSQEQLKNLIKVFRVRILENYNYKSATKSQKEQFRIKTNKYIFTEKEQEEQCQ